MFVIEVLAPDAREPYVITPPPEHAKTRDAAVLWVRSKLRESGVVCVWNARPVGES